MTTQCETLLAALKRGERPRHGCSVKNGSQGYKTFIAWQSMLWRCNNPNRRDYKDYGARGIAVCARWRDFGAFLLDVGLKPEGYTLGRIDNDGQYEPGNVRWETPRQQARNRSSNTRITFNGQTKNLCEWAEETGVRRDTIGKRLEKGWSVERALSTPTLHRSQWQARGKACLPVPL